MAAFLILFWGLLDGAVVDNVCPNATTGIDAPTEDLGYSEF